ncbi:MAG: class I SAM-dependent methyltransferase, partial [Deltaproteobacteria bacterium]
GTGILLQEAVTVFNDTRFILADPSTAMLARANIKLGEHPRVTVAEPAGSGELQYPSGSLAVITAIQSHHYMTPENRKLATANCFRMLVPGGIYVTFENIRPFTPAGIEIGLRRWADFQAGCGKPLDEASKHVARFDKEFYPITIEEHLDLLRSAGFSTVEILWSSYMQAGFYAIK